MKRLLGVLAAGVVGMISIGALGADAARNVIEEANAEYAEGAKKLSSDRDGAIESFKKSAELYKQAAEAAPGVSGELMYNIGNASMLARETGEAVLWYKRAERAMPNSAAVRANLAKAREKVGANVPRADSLMAQLTILEFVPAAVRFWVAAAGLAGMWGLLLVRVWSVGGWRPSRVGVAACGVAALLAGASLVPREMRLREASEAVVLVETTGRAGPDAEAYEAKPASPLKGGTEVRVVEERGPWLLVELGDGTRSWVEGKGMGRVAGKSTK
jgi:hypothetical protein